MFIISCPLGTVRDALGDTDCFEHAWLITQQNESLSRDFYDTCSGSWFLGNWLGYAVFIKWCSSSVIASEVASRMYTKNNV